MEPTNSWEITYAILLRRPNHKFLLDGTSAEEIGTKITITRQYEIRRWLSATKDFNNYWIREHI